MGFCAVNNDTTDLLLHCIFARIMKWVTTQTAYSNRYVTQLWRFKYVSDAVFNIFAKQRRVQWLAQISNESTHFGAL